MIFQSGVMVSVGYQGENKTTSWGEKALPLIAAIDEIECHFKANQVQKDVAISVLSLELTKKTCQFFGLEYKPPTDSDKESSDIEIAQLIRQIIPSNRKKILVADDSAFVRNLIKKTLGSEKYKIIEAKNGFEALAQLNDANPDLLLLDIIMPGSLDGYKVLDLIKKNEKFNKLPIIILTSRDSLLDKMRGKMSASDEYLTKPFNEAQLLAVIEQYVV